MEVALKESGEFKWFSTLKMAASCWLFS